MTVVARRSSLPAVADQIPIETPEVAKVPPLSIDDIQIRSKWKSRSIGTILQVH